MTKSPERVVAELTPSFPDGMRQIGLVPRDRVLTLSGTNMPHHVPVVPRLTPIARLLLIHLERMGAHLDWRPYIRSNVAKELEVTEGSITTAIARLEAAKRIEHVRASRWEKARVRVLVGSERAA